ncbi:hypothetical protein KIL84_004681 [Mauremys mutica]|uniref:Uncharacterized protein n=1 Tax=Mauremys mutica TaxID=74926 RepID=A0A9D3XKK4_9SAUR|nr:hypothetical protein KIL84_004681 [Mauremys mutica]
MQHITQWAPQLFALTATHAVHNTGGTALNCSKPHTRSVSYRGHCTELHEWSQNHTYTCAGLARGVSYSAAQTCTCGITTKCTGKQMFSASKNGDTVTEIEV